MWAAELSRACARIEPLFSRWEVHQRAVDYVNGLLSCSGRKNSWWLAEQAGHVSPDGMQWLLRGAVWSADALRDEVRAYVGERFADVDGVLVVGEAGFAKRGRKSVGVAKQLDPVNGRMENCQLALFTGYRSRHGCALVDRELYLPREWVDDVERRLAAGVPPTVGFATRAELAARMVTRTVEADLPVRWVTAGQLGPDCRVLRERCTALGLRYLFEIAPDQPLTTAPGQVRTARALAAAMPDRAFEAVDANPAEERAWAVLRLGPSLGPSLQPNGGPGPGPSAGQAPAGDAQRLLLVGRRTSEPTQATYHYAVAPAGVTLGELLTVLAARPAFARCVDAARRETGLDHYEVRKWDPWFRHVTLSMFAFACLQVMRARGISVADLERPRREQALTHISARMPLSTATPVVAPAPSRGR